MFPPSHRTRVHHRQHRQTHGKTTPVRVTHIYTTTGVDRFFATIRMRVCNVNVFFSRLMAGYKKMHKFSSVISYFSLQSWLFRDSNTRSLVQKLSKLDQSLFNFDIAQLDWNDYFIKHVRGIRLYILKDPIESLPKAIKHTKRSVPRRSITCRY